MTRQPRVSRSVWALGLASLLIDVSSALVHSFLPLFVVVTLGAGATWLGLIEGAAEAATCIVRVFSAALSPRISRRKPFALLGYGLAVLTKPVFPVAGSIGSVLAARCVDRIGKGIRAVTREAMMADLTVRAERGAALGLQYSLDTIGAFAGPLLAMVLATVFRGDVRAVFWVALIPAVMSATVLWVSVKEPARERAVSQGRLRLRFRALPTEFWTLCVVAALYMLARFSEGFLVLCGARAGLPIPWSPLTLVVVNAAYLLSAYPAGRLSDFIPRSGFLIAAFVMLIAANLVLASSVDPLEVLLACVLWGLHMGLSEGVFLAMVANAVPAGQRASAFGLFNLMRGAWLLVGNVIAGLLWEAVAPSATFAVSAVLSTLALAAFCLARFLTRL